MSDAPPFLAIGHRGARGHAPENTLRALETGIRLGADWLEFDVRQHSSGELVLLHDAWVDRTTDGHGALNDLSLAELKALDAGEGQHIPTLAEALDLVEQRAGVNVELKSFGGAGAALAAVLEGYIAAGWPRQRFLVSSFHLPELWEFKQAAPDIPIAALVGGVPLDWAAGAVELGAVALNVDAEFADPRLVTAAHSHGLRVYAYTVNRPEEMWQLRRIGVDGVFTDYPERVKPIAG
ncbi:MAG TPA: glycerophosphodiester phosphodiesterase family protein [Nevskiaceae bacterium]|nr:glycerophosphodiester phosphodiesterase family protein [Nevskiaceae bacterium]